ncbi:alpha/beta-Hydrolases superfamily protein, partial [Zea mays]
TKCRLSSPPPPYRRCRWPRGPGTASGLRLPTPPPPRTGPAPLPDAPAPAGSRPSFPGRWSASATALPSAWPSESSACPSRPVFSGSAISSSCVRPLKQQQDGDPVVLLHGFDSSVLEWRYTYPLLEEAGLEAWAVDILGWGFSDLETRPPCDVASKREHFYQVL